MNPSKEANEARYRTIYPEADLPPPDAFLWYIERKGLEAAYAIDMEPLKARASNLLEALKLCQAERDRWQQNYNDLLDAQMVEIKKRQDAEAEQERLKAENESLHKRLLALREARTEEHQLEVERLKADLQSCHDSRDVMATQLNEYVARLATAEELFEEIMDGDFIPSSYQISSDVEDWLERKEQK